MVKINKKSIIDHNLKFIRKFKKINIIIGYKYEKILAKFKNQNFNFIRNTNYKKSNMVESTFLSNPTSNKIVICYGDILFDHRIFELIKNNDGNFILIKKNWLQIWKKRMTYNKIFKDAEDLVVDKKNRLISIGGKINKLPDYQYMGIICLTNGTFKKLKRYFKTLDKKIDFTTFIKLSIQKKISNFKVIKTTKFWTEIDTEKDILAANEMMKKLKKNLL